MIFSRSFNRQYRTLCHWNFLKVSPEVKDAILNRQAVVALESTVITHGMPWPNNFKIALDLEQIVRLQGAIPATIGIINGQIKVGLTQDELEQLARSPDGQDKPVKISRHNFYKTTEIKYGGTTVCGTLIVCEKLGIKIFATGGIGGVHRDVNETMDISADLQELARSKVCVVSSGIKSILDIGKTLEYLETHGVFVASLNNDYFPGFFTMNSPIKSPNNCRDLDEVVRLIKNMNDFQVNSSILLGVSIPKQLEQSGQEVHKSIEKALALSKENQITGSESTPFLLKTIMQMTKGQSLFVNQELIKNNAKIAGQLSVKLMEYYKKTNANSKPDRDETGDVNPSKNLLVIGASVVDINSYFDDPQITGLDSLTTAATYNCNIEETCGGVGRNMAEALARICDNSKFISILGSDIKSDFIKQNSSSNLNWNLTEIIQGKPTSSFTVLHLKNKDILFHFGDVKSTEYLTPSYLEKSFHYNNINELSIEFVMIDCNISVESIEYLNEFCCNRNIPLLIEPTDVLLLSKLTRLLQLTKPTENLRIITPNIHEFQVILKLLNSPCNFPLNIQSDNILKDLKQILTETKLLSVVPCWFVKLGKEGICMISNQESYLVKPQSNFINPMEIKSISGAGDCQTASLVHLKYNCQMEWLDCLLGSHRIVGECLRSPSAVPSSIHKNQYQKPEILQWNRDYASKYLRYVTL